MKNVCVALGLFLAATFSAICLFPSPGRAYCVYNHTNTDFTVCGESCSKCFYEFIESGDHGCCPGGHKGCGGETFITIHPRSDHYEADTYGWYPPIQVTAHGWVSIHGKCKEDVSREDACDDLWVEVNNDHGHLIYKGKMYRFFGRWSHCRDD